MISADTLFHPGCRQTVCTNPQQRDPAAGADPQSLWSIGSPHIACLQSALSLPGDPERSHRHPA